MSHLLILLFRIVIVADLVTLAVFVADYSRLARWYRDPIGRTIVVKDLLLGAALTPSALSLFFKFGRLASQVAAWVDVGLFAGIAVVMVWRVVVFEKFHRALRGPGGDADTPERKGLCRARMARRRVVLRRRADLRRGPAAFYCVAAPGHAYRCGVVLRCPGRRRVAAVETVEGGTRVTDVAAHEQAESHHYVVHFPPHPARKDDPHYADFDHYHRQTRAAARCYVGERVGYGDCRDAKGTPCPPPDGGGEQPGLELHHAHVEFSLQNGVSLTALEEDYPGISDPSQVGAWVESAQNFRWLCVAEGSPVLMADRTTKPIEYVLPGESVIGKDGLPHPVEVTSRKRYRGELVSFGGASFTPEHRLLSHRGWLPAAHVARQVWMHGPEMIALRGEQRQVGAGVVGAVPVEVMHSLLRQQEAAYPGFHDDYVFHPQPTAVPDPDVPLRGDLRGAVAEVPVRELVQLSQAATVGAVPAGVRAGLPVGGPVERGSAGFAGPDMGWVAAVPRRTAAFTGWVHDLSIAHSHSFVVGGIVAHNCVFHHRGPGGAHTASHSDWEGGQYVLGLISGA